MVKTNILPTSLAMLLTLIVAVTASAQDRRRGPSGIVEYDVTRETTVTGTIVRTYVGPFGELLVLEIATDGRALHLLLAPPDAVKKHSFPFTAGAAVEVIGIPGYKVDGATAMLARQVKSGKRTLTLRDATGKPTW